MKGGYHVDTLRSEWGVIGFGMPQRRWAFRQARFTARVVIGSPGRSPGKSQGVERLTRHQSRRIASNVGDYEFMPLSWNDSHNTMYGSVSGAWTLKDEAAGTMEAVKKEAAVVK